MTNSNSHPNSATSTSTSPSSMSMSVSLPRTLLPSLTTSLQNFIQSSSSTSFRILYTHPPTRLPPPSALPLKTLYVLDSSFNPPSRAHAWLSRDALLDGVRRNLRRQEDDESGSGNGRGRTEGGSGSAGWEGIRLLLLLATQNADKPSKPVAFEERVGMMVLMARELYAQLLQEAEQAKLSGGGVGGAGNARDDGGLGSFAVDVGVIKQPFFMDKAAAIEESGVYGDRERFEQVHLTGFDTLMRIFDTKYYGEEGFRVLEPFLERGRVRAVIRPGEKYGKLEEQKGWIDRVRRGDFEGQGLKREWAERVEMVEDVEGEVSDVSSTRVREGVRSGDWKTVEGLVGKEVMEWIRERRLYVDDEGKL